MALPDDARLGPPYGRAHGYWRKHPKRDLPLSDEEIYALVLARALADHAGIEPIEVVRMRARGASPREIAARRQGPEDTAPPARPGDGDGPGKGKDKGKGKK